MFALTVTLVATAGAEEQVAEGVRALATASRRERDVVEWRVHRSIEDPRRFLLYELYRDATGLDRHRATEHFATYQREVLPLVEDRQPATWEELPASE
jgi:(4S)-4-hydroxy-5-phosphonooxypentane-2,3-dione isomerase